MSVSFSPFVRKYNVKSTFEHSQMSGLYLMVGHKTPVGVFNNSTGGKMSLPIPTGEKYEDRPAQYYNFVVYLKFYKHRVAQQYMRPFTAHCKL